MPQKNIKQEGEGQVWVSDAQDIHNNSSLVKITHNGTISVKCLNDSLQITILEKQFTVSGQKQKTQLEICNSVCYLPCLHMEGNKTFFKFRECFALDTVNV